MKIFRLTLLLMLVAAVLPGGLVGWYALHETRELLARDAQELAQERVQRARLSALHFVEAPVRSARAVAATPGFGGLALADQQLQLRTLLQQHPSLVGVALIDAQGQRLTGRTARDPRRLGDSDVEALRRRAVAALPLDDGPRYGGTGRTSLGERVVTFVVPLAEPPGAALAADLALGELDALLAQHSNGARGRSYIVNTGGEVIAGRPSFETLRPAPGQSQPLSAAPDQVLQVTRLGRGAEELVAAWVGLPSLGWTLVSEQPTAEAYASVGSLTRAIGLAMAMGAAVALVLSILFSRNLTRPLQRFAKASLELAAGRFGIQVKVESKDEVGELARTFNYMSMQLDAYHQETGRLYTGLEQGYLETIVSLANSIDSKDPYTRGHSQRVGDMSMEIGRELGLTPRELKLLHYGGILHDIGKIGITDTILCKQSRLTEDEMVVMRTHPEIGDTIVAPITFLATVRSAVRSHHERYDGTGYPDRLKGEEIPLIARIVNCADTFDACTSTRPYQVAMPLHEAWAILERLRNTQLDPTVLDALRRVLEKQGAKLEAPPKASASLPLAS